MVGREGARRGTACETAGPDSRTGNGGQSPAGAKPIVLTDVGTEMRSPRGLVLSIATAVSAIAPLRESSACGLTPPIGPSGLPTICHGGTAPRVHAGLSVGGTSTSLRFPSGRAELLQGASVLSLDVNPLVGTVAEPLTLSITAGASLGGHVDYAGVRYTLSQGVVVGGGVAYRLGGRGGAPFVQPSLSLAYSGAAKAEGPDGRRESFTAIDYRAGLAVGKVVGGFAAPFAVVRYFGGGTEWELAGGHGRDRFLYQAGLGSAFALGPRLDLVAEVAFLGEGRATAGVGWSF